MKPPAEKPAIKILLTSGFADQAIFHEKDFISGFKFIQKPFTSRKLLQKVREVLND